LYSCVIGHYDTVTVLVAATIPDHSSVAVVPEAGGFPPNQSAAV
jgi:hypothetical protein